MDVLINIGYLVAAVLFILGVKGLTSPKTAVQGNKMSASAMLIAVIAALLDSNVITYEYILIGVLIGGVIGAFIAKKVAMTDMPEMVATLNGIGGGASLLVAAANYLESQQLADMGKFAVTYDWSVAVILSILIGAVTLTGSFVAVGKLKGKIGDSNKVKLYKWIVKLCFATLIAGAVYFTAFSQLNSDSGTWYNASLGNLCRGDGLAVDFHYGYSLSGRSCLLRYSWPCLDSGGQCRCRLAGRP